MSERDRLVLIVCVVLASLVATWMFVVSPERQAAASVSTQVSQAQQTLSTAQSSLGTALASKRRYPAAYAALVGVGKAVPASPEVPSLVYELDQASSVRNVEFAGITAGGSAGGAGSGSASSASAAATAGGFTTLPFTFAFTGTFFDLYHLLGRLNAFAVQTKNGTLIVTGRLLTIQGVNLAPLSTASASASGGSGANVLLTGTVTADAYVMPASTPSSGTGSGTPATTPTGGSTTSGTPAVIQANP